MRESLLELAQRIQRGEQRAIRPFMALLWPEGIHYLRKHTSLPRQEVEERVNDALADLCCILIKGKSLDNPRAYFYEMLRNRSYNRKVQREKARQHQQDTLSVLAESGQEPADPQGADQQLLNVEMVRWVDSLLARLDHKCRQIIQKTLVAQYREAQKVDLAQVAQELELKNRQTLSTSKSRCLKRIKEQFYHSYQAMYLEHHGNK